MIILAQRKYLNHNHFGLLDKTLPIILAQSLTPQNFLLLWKVVRLKLDQPGLVATALKLSKFH
jgi:hypothetical protein